MPFSKHTKTMDYEQYLSAMLGLENSVRLIYDLTKFARKGKYLQFKKAEREEDDHTFGSYLNDLMENYESLVNINYDPYGITFPPAFKDVDEQDLNHKFMEIKTGIENLNPNSNFEA